MKHPPNITDPLDRARTLRRLSTDAEKRLWAALRNRRLDGWKFRRQTWIGPYVADFVCTEAGLVIEADGGQHAEAVAYDTQRSGWLAEEGFRVLRFWNNDVLTNTDGVLRAILGALRATPHPPTAARRAPPSPPGGEGL
jgi:very-short-patch-repair endonuclease